MRSATSSARRHWRRPRWSRGGARRATRSAWRRAPRRRSAPIGIYTIPEIACVGLSEDEAQKRYPGERILVGRGRFEEVARGQISGVQDGLLKMVADSTGHKLLGVQIVGEGATELIHLGQMALLSGTSVESFVENVFNFPTLAEAYRVAALDVLERSR